MHPLLRPHLRCNLTSTLRLNSHWCCQRLRTQRPLSNEAFTRGYRKRNFSKYGVAVGGAFAAATAAWLYYSSYDGPRKLDTFKFAPTTLQSSEAFSSDSKIIRLRLPPELLPDDVDNVFRPIWSLKFKNSDIQVERAYTPLKGISEDGEMIFWIRRYEHGEMGRWMHERKPGDVVEVRGPERTWAGNVYDYDHVIMIAGGTGITPFYQLLHSIFASGKCKSIGIRTPKLTLLHSHRSPQSLPPYFILNNLSTWATEHAAVFTLATFVDEYEGGMGKWKYKQGRITRSDVEQALCSKVNSPTSPKTIILICGPDSMVTAFAGPKGHDLSQGPIGGILASLGYNQHNVWKL